MTKSAVYQSLEELQASLFPDMKPGLPTQSPEFDIDDLPGDEVDALTERLMSELMKSLDKSAPEPEDL